MLNIVIAVFKTAELLNMLQTDSETRLLGNNARRYRQEKDKKVNNDNTELLQYTRQNVTTFE